MDGDAEEQERAREEVARLYWSSSMSVNSIADELGISKGTLYDWVDPLPAGLPCPTCRGELAFPNRTARERGFLECPECGLEEEVTVVRESMHERTARTAGRPPPTGDGEGSEATGGRYVLAIALLGAAAGVAVASWLRRR